MAEKKEQDQIDFLLTCLANLSTPAKPDFDKVATKLGIVSKGAAQKRFERMLKAHGSSLKEYNAEAGGEAPTTPQKRKKDATAEDTPGKKPKRTPLKDGVKREPKEEPKEEELKVESEGE